MKTSTHALTLLAASACWLGCGGGAKTTDAASGDGSVRDAAMNDGPTDAMPDLFLPKVDFPLTNLPGAAPQSIAVGDINGDGKPDLATADGANTSNVSVFLNTTTTGATTPSLATRTDFATGSQPAAVSLGDLNGDGKPDLVTANASGSVSVLLNTTSTGATSPTFAAKVDLSTPNEHPSSVACSDINGDGKLDLVVAAEGPFATAGAVTIFLNTTANGAMTPSFSSGANFTANKFAQFVTAGDLNAEGRPDLVVANAPTKNVSVFLNTTSTGATTPTLSSNVDLATTGPDGDLAIAVGGLNGDAQPDLAIATYNGPISVFLNTTSAGATTPTFGARADFLTGTGSILGGTFVAIGDFDRDGKPDLAITAHDRSTSTDVIAILLNTATTGATAASFSGPLTYPTGVTPSAVEVADINGDGKPDLVTANDGASVSILLAR